jgi:hypothetical protein
MIVMSVSSLCAASRLLLMIFSAQRNVAASPLLRLPAEIRNAIYGYVFMDWEVRVSSTFYERRRFYVEIRDPPQAAVFFSETTATQIFLAITTTSRQLRSETALLPFQHVAFAAYSKELKWWAHARLQDAQRNAIATVTYIEPIATPYQPFKAWLEASIATFPGIKRVIVLHDPEWHSRETREEVEAVGQSCGVEVVYSAKTFGWW